MVNAWIQALGRLNSGSNVYIIPRKQNPIRTDIKFRPTNSNNVPLNYGNIKSLSIPNNEDLQPIKVTNPKKANWWSKQTKNNKILIASVGLITVASIIYFMTKKKK
jgi:hypothetical protein